MSKARNSSYLVLASIFTFGLKFLAIRYYQQWIGFGGLGLYSEILGLGQFLCLIDINFSIGAVKRITEHLHEKKPEKAIQVQQCMISLNLITALGAMVVYYLAAHLYPAPKGEAARFAGDVPWMIVLSGVLLVLTLMNTTLTVALTAREKFGSVAVRGSLAQFLSVVVSLIGTYFYRTPIALMVGTILGSFFGTLYNLGTIKRIDPTFRFRPKWDKEIARDLFRYSLHALPHRVSSALSTSVDKVIIPQALGTVSLGYYSTAYRFPDALSNMFSSVTSTVVPHLTRAAMGSAQKFAYLVDRYARIALAFGVGLILIPAGFAHSIFAVWLTKPIPHGPEVALFIGGYFCFEYYFIGLTKVFYARGRLQWMAPFAAFNGLVTLALTYTVAKNYGVVGVAVQNFCVDILQLIPMLFVVRRHAAPGFPVWKHLIQAILTLSIGWGFAVAGYKLCHLPYFEARPFAAIALIPVFSAVCLLLIYGLRLCPVPDAIRKRIRFLPNEMYEEVEQMGV